MTEGGKFQNKPRRDMSDYNLWEIRKLTVIKAESLNKVFEPNEYGDRTLSLKDISCNAAQGQCQQTSKTRVSALIDNSVGD